MNHADLRLQVGGTLNPRRHVYIERPEDARVFELLLHGEYVNVLSARQMGKSSLMVRTMDALRARGVRTATVDLASEVGAPAEPAAFFQTLLARIAEALDLDIDVETWWREHRNQTVNQHVLAFFRDEVLGRIAGPVVIFLDEIDSTLRLPYTDDLFTTIRGMYNQRATAAAYQRLTFCLLGVATPNELIKDRRTTPYNVGVTVELRDFDASRDDLAALASRLAGEPEVADRLLHRMLFLDRRPALPDRESLQRPGRRGERGRSGPGGGSRVLQPEPARRRPARADHPRLPRHQGGRRAGRV